MKAIAYQQAGGIDVLSDIIVPKPEAQGYDLLVEISAIAVNPVDCKVRAHVTPEPDQPKILGWDAVGIVREVGNKVSLFKPGDQVWYAGDLTRQGCNSEFHLVDERIVGLKPRSLTDTEAAALPLTTLTAWELLFDRLQINRKDEGSLLITGAAGGVGSILVQLAKQLTPMTVIGTASRPESQQWVRDRGADLVIDHQSPMLAQLQAHGIKEVDYVISLTHTDQHAEELINCLKPQGKFALIDDPLDLDIKLFKRKSISIHWEMMYTRSMYHTVDMIEQHRILTRVADMVDSGRIKTTLNGEPAPINAKNLRLAHQQIEGGRSLGKVVLSGFGD